MIPWANGLSSKETWVPRANGPQFPRKHASLGNDPRLWGNHGSVGEMGSSFEGTTWSKGISFIHRMQSFFQVFVQYATYHPYNANVSKSTFHPYFVTFFSNFRCQMLHNVDKNYKMDELLCTFYRICIEQLGQGEYKSSLLREVVTPLSSCDN